MLSIDESKLGALIVDGLDSGEHYRLGNDSLISIETSGSHLRIKYESNFGTENITLPGFHLQYIGEGIVF